MHHFPVCSIAFFNVLAKARQTKLSCISLKVRSNLPYFVGKISIGIYIYHKIIELNLFSLE